MKNKLIAWLIAGIMVVGCIGIPVVSAADDWDWINYGFSGTAVVGFDPVETSTRLIGGYVATVRKAGYTPASYIYHSKLVLDTEGVALRFRLSWVNTEAGFRAVADLADGVAVYPMDKSIDVAVTTPDGLLRCSFPAPRGYDYLAANDFTIKDNGSCMIVTVNGKTVAILRFEGTHSENGHTYVNGVTLTDGNGYIYGRCEKSLVLAENSYLAYSSQSDRALIAVMEHELTETTFDDPIPEAKETEAGWVPETEPEIESATGAVEETEAVTDPLAETVDETSAVGTSTGENTGCGSAVGVGVPILLLGAAVTLFCRKKD